MKKYLVFGEKTDGYVERFQCVADSKEEAEMKILSTTKDLVRAKAFDWNIQFS
jgi:hypothetical protein